MDNLYNELTEIERDYFKQILDFSPLNFDFMTGVTSWDNSYAKYVCKNKMTLISMVIDKNTIWTKDFIQQAAMVLILTFSDFEKSRSEADCLIFYSCLKSIIKHTSDLNKSPQTESYYNLKSALGFIAHLQRNVYNAQKKIRTSHIYTTKENLNKKFIKHNASELNKINTNIKKIVETHYSELCDSICERINPIIAEEINKGTIDISSIIIDSISVNETDQYKNAKNMLANVADIITTQDITDLRYASFFEFAKLPCTRNDKTLNKYFHINRKGFIENTTKNYTEYLKYLLLNCPYISYYDITEDLSCIKNNLPVLKLYDIYAITYAISTYNFFGDRSIETIKNIISRYNNLISLKLFKFIPVINKDVRDVKIVIHDNSIRYTKKISSPKSIISSFMFIFFIFPILMMYAAVALCFSILLLPAEFYSAKKNNRKFSIKKHFNKILSFNSMPERHEHFSDKAYQTALNDYYYSKNNHQSLHIGFNCAIIIDLVIILLFVGSFAFNKDTPPPIPDNQIVISNNTPTPTPTGIVVYVTDYGKKYHREYCQYLYSSKYEISLESAEKRGYSPCSVCNPPQ